MTGFGEASSHNDESHYFLEVRSLNGKYFKSTIRLPEELQGLEPVLEAELRRRCVRGTITAIGKCNDTSEAAAYDINRDALEHYLKQLRQIPSVADGSYPVNVSELLSLPGVLQTPSNEEERYQRAKEAFMKLVVEACDELLGMRLREGELLVEDLMIHHQEIARHLINIADRAPTVVEDYQNRLQARMSTLLADAKVTVDPTTLIKEVAIYAERSDISEEIARLSGHLQQFKGIITTDSDKPIGRTLDFLSQEMLREANTIASKSSDAEISRAIVEIKGSIDRIKEQVQNVV